MIRTGAVPLSGKHVCRIILVMICAVLFACCAYAEETGTSTGQQTETAGGGTSDGTEGQNTGNETESETETETETETENQDTGDGSSDGSEEAVDNVDDDEEDAKEVGMVETDGNVVLMAMSASLPAGKLVKKDGTIRYQLKDGTYLTKRWVRINGYIYRFEENGEAVRGKYRFNEKAYYFDDLGHLYIHRFRKAGGNWYWYGEDGVMVKNGWVKVTKSQRYYAQENGVIARSKWVNGNYFNANGRYNYQKGTLNTGKYKKSTAKRKLILVGASRTRQMQKAVGNKSGVVWIAHSGQAFKWLKNTAYRQLKSQLKRYPQSQVVIQMGNNDIRYHKTAQAFAKYKKFYKSLIKKYPKAKFYFMDILPMKNRDSSRDRRAREFNELLKNTFPKQYIAGYDYLVNKGYNMSYDAIHYSVDTYRKIFNFILKKTR